MNIDNLFISNSNFLEKGKFEGKKLSEETFLESEKETLRN